MNVNEIINSVKEVALSQAPVMTAYDGDVYENWNKAEAKYGSFNIGLKSINYNGNLVTYTFLLYYGDRLLQDKSNINNVYIDGVNVIQSVVNILNSSYKMDIDESVNYTPFEQQFMDYLGGVYAQVDITTDSPIGLCSMDSYEYEDDKNKLIEKLIEEINKYKAQDAQLALLLQEILHKINGETFD